MTFLVTAYVVVGVLVGLGISRHERQLYRDMLNGRALSGRTVNVPEPPLFWVIAGAGVWPALGVYHLLRVINSWLDARL